MLIAGLHAPKVEVLVPLPAIGKIQILFIIAIVENYFFLMPFDNNNLTILVINFLENLQKDF